MAVVVYSDYIPTTHVYWSVYNVSTSKKVGTDQARDFWRFVSAWRQAHFASQAKVVSPWAITTNKVFPERTLSFQVSFFVLVQPRLLLVYLENLNRKTKSLVFIFYISCRAELGWTFKKKLKIKPLPSACYLFSYVCVFHKINSVDHGAWTRRGLGPPAFSLFSRNYSKHKISSSDHQTALK